MYILSGGKHFLGFYEHFWAQYRSFLELFDKNQLTNLLKVNYEVVTGGNHCFIAPYCLLTLTRISSQYLYFLRLKMKFWNWKLKRKNSRKDHSDITSDIHIWDCWQPLPLSFSTSTFLLKTLFHTVSLIAKLTSLGIFIPLFSSSKLFWYNRNPHKST